MIIQILLALINIIITLLFFWLPPGDRLPFGLDDIFIMASQYFRSFMEIFWPLQIVLEAFLIYLGFLIAMKIVRIFIGNRSPVTD